MLCYAMLCYAMLCYARLNDGGGGGVGGGGGGGGGGVGSGGADAAWLAAAVAPDGAVCGVGDDYGDGDECDFLLLMRMMR